MDDNRELFIPETQETIKAHPKFMLFATQNPPGHYGGRKVSLNVVYFVIIVVICNLDIFPLISTNDIVSINEMTDSENYQSSVMSNALWRYGWKINGSYEDLAVHYHRYHSSSCLTSCEISNNVCLDLHWCRYSIE